MLNLLDILFLWLHIVVIGFNLFGWIWWRTRKLHLIVSGITLFSWILLGIKYGFGYCFLTDWHWDVKYKLGQTDLPASFVKYFLDEHTSFVLTDVTVDWITGISFGLAILCSLYLNFLRKPKQSSH